MGGKMFEFKEKPTERNIIVIIDYDTKRNLISNPKGLEIKTDSPIMVVENDELLKKDNYPFVVNLKKRGLIKPGEILIQDYYDEDNYFPATEAKYKTAVKKVMLYQTFFFLLGAKNFNYLEVKEMSDNSETRIEGNTESSYGPFSANASAEYKTKIQNLLKSQLSVKTEVKKQKCNINEAEDFIYQKRLNNDLLLENILENFKRGRDLEKTNVKIRLFQEINQVISILGNIKLDLLGFSFKANGGLYQEMKSTSDFIAEFDVSWV